MARSKHAVAAITFAMVLAALAAAPVAAQADLCAANGVIAGSVTKKVCASTPDVCEVYIKKGNENGVSNIKTCRQYCNAYGMDCTAQFEDKKNSCVRDYEYVCTAQKGHGHTFPECDGWLRCVLLWVCRLCHDASRNTSPIGQLIGRG